MNHAEELFRSMAMVVVMVVNVAERPVGN